MQGKKVHFIPRRIELIIPKKCQCALIPSLLRAGRSTLNVFSPQREKRMRTERSHVIKLNYQFLNEYVGVQLAFSATPSFNTRRAEAGEL